MDIALPSKILSAFLLALLGGAHCAAMCGGFVAAVHAHPAPGARPIAVTLGWNAGRLLGYASAGLLAGAIGGSLYAARVLPLQIFLLAAGSLVLAGVGASLLGARGWQRALEPLGGGLWRRIAPVAGKLFPPRDARTAIAAGWFWGWIPCGMAYSALPIALVAGSAPAGAAVMLAFGIGTLPNLLALHAGAARMAGRDASTWLRMLAACVIFVFSASGLAHAARLAGARSPAIAAVASLCHDAPAH